MPSARSRELSAAFLAASMVSLCAQPPPASAAAPVPGFADLHNHQMNHLGFGGRVIHGDAFGPIDQALPHCSANHGPLGFSAPWLAGPHLVGGYPEFDGWPSHALKTHQQVYEAWLRRAHDGGLNLIVMLAGHNEHLCKLDAFMPSAAPHRGCGGMKAVYAEIERAKEMDAQREWYEIVYSPAEARRVIAEGKLAVVLGVEIPYLFGCGTGDPIGEALWGAVIDAVGPPELRPALRDLVRSSLKAIANNTCNQEQVRVGLDRLHDAGVRHLFPIHNANNGFGGAALYNFVFTLPSPELNVPGLRNCSAEGYTFNGGRCNERAYTPLGRYFLGELMRKGVMIDIDHNSHLAKLDLLKIAERLSYPLVSSHTGFLEISRGDRRHEGNMSGAFLERIRALGGVIAPIVVQGSAAETLSWRGKIPHTCDESAESFAQAYLYLAEKMQGAPVPIGSDFNGLAGLPGPRFGGALRLETANGTFLGAALGGGGAAGAAIKDAGEFETFQLVDHTGGALKSGDVVSFRTSSRRHYLGADLTLLGALVASATKIGAWERFTVEKSGGGPILDKDVVTLKASNGKYVAVAEAFGIVAANQSAASSAARFTVHYAGDAVFGGCYAQRSRPAVTYPFTSPITGKKFDRQVIGERIFDINVDGLANVGMLPDFIEELRVLGLSDADLQPLFSSAEGYIRAWERAEEARGRAEHEVLRLPLGAGEGKVADADWSALARYCGARRLRLATRAELCPGGAGATPIFPQPKGDVWLAVGDHPNAWSSVGTSNPARRCRLHEEVAGSAPAWGLDRGPEPATQQAAAVVCVRQLERVSLRDAGGSFNHEDAARYCGDRGLRLIRHAELCPQGPNHPPTSGSPAGDVWAPVDDGANAWVSVGTSNPERLCHLHDDLGGPPSWGTKKGPEPATGEPAGVLCVP